MAHSFRSSGVTFLYNSDLSGEVTIITGSSEEKEIKVLGSALLAFVAEHVRREKIDALERATIKNLLGIV